MTESIESNFISMRPAVEFVDILDQYSYNNDLECKFMFNDYIPQEGDRIAIFKLGWSFVKDYIVFEWAPVGNSDRICKVNFNKHILPKNTTEIYQICYISGENQLQGATSPFQFSSEENQLNLDSCMLNIPTPIVSLESLAKSQIVNKEKADEEISKLKEENAMLRESLKAVIAQKNAQSANKTYDQEIEELKTITENLRIAVVKQEKEISILKKKIQDGGEEYKKLYLEKIKVEKKYEKLKSMGKKEECKPNNQEVWLNFDMGEFKSIPPFPYAKNA